MNIEERIKRIALIVSASSENIVKKEFKKLIRLLIKEKIRHPN